MDKEKVIILEQSRIRLQELLNRISVQEKKTRSAINAIRDFIITVNKKGRILHSNTSFDKLFVHNGITSQDHAHINGVFTELENNFFKKMKPLEVVNTSIKRNEEAPIPIQISVTSLKQDGLDYAPPTNDLVSDLFDEDDNEEAFIIVARNMTAELKIAQEKKEKEDMMAKLRKNMFETQFRVPQFRRALSNYLRQSNLHVNVSFLEKCMAYRTKSIEQRIQECNQIYEKYLKIGAERCINISPGLSEHYRVKVSKSVGDEDLFRELEELAKSQILKEAYEKFVVTQEEIDN
jgi:hypothetical protein